ncbi:hypothetical protein P9761_22385 [Brevibacillus centrosporus]|uniref:hypothetical protein n=1 Tax=Brevibacillus centrosporus TaxID=54910 RepID=UPI002E1C1057|nr:hypothetical protein [Brevibacillus centrosporus]
MKEEDRIPRDRTDEQTVTSLLSHLQEMRQAVPVNYQLKTELKKQLLQRMKELELQKTDSVVVKMPHSRKKLLRVCAAVMIAAITVGVYSWWEKDVLAVDKQGLLTLPAHTTEEQVDIDPTGKEVAYLVSPSVIRTVSVDEKKHPENISLPATAGEYRALSWANHNEQVAVVEQSGKQARIWIVDIPDQNNVSSSRLLKEEENVTYHSPAWSPGDETIAYTRIKDGVEEIWVSSTVSFQEWKLAEGSQPEWSPDGRFLAYTKAGKVQVMEVRTGNISVLGDGKWPSWSQNAALTYTSPEGGLVEAQVDEKPFASKELELLNLFGEQVVRGSWSSEGNQLLVVHRDEQPKSLVISLASR